MLKVANKRSFDAMALETPNVQGASIRPSPQWMEPSSKRHRPESWSALATPPQQENTGIPDVAYTPTESDIAALSPDDRKLLEWMPKNKRLKFLANGPHAKLFTGVDVKQTLEAAIDETRRMLSAEYEKILQQRLSEQFQNFSKFSQEVIHRKLSQSSHDYIS